MFLRFLFLIVFCFLAQSTFSETSDSSIGISQEMIKKVDNSVVRIMTTVDPDEMVPYFPTQENAKRVALGFFIDKDTVLTDYDFLWEGVLYDEYVNSSESLKIYVKDSQENIFVARIQSASIELSFALLKLEPLKGYEKPKSIDLGSTLLKLETKEKRKENFLTFRSKPIQVNENFFILGKDHFYNPNKIDLIQAYNVPNISGHFYDGSSFITSSTLLESDSLGSPIFDSQGQFVSFVSFVDGNYSTGINQTYFKSFLEGTYKRQLKNTNNLTNKEFLFKTREDIYKRAVDGDFKSQLELGMLAYSSRHSTSGTFWSRFLLRKFSSDGPFSNMNDLINASIDTSQKNGNLTSLLVSLFLIKNITNKNNEERLVNQYLKRVESHEHFKQDPYLQHILGVYYFFKFLDSKKKALINPEGEEEGYKKFFTKFMEHFENSKSLYHSRTYEQLIEFYGGDAFFYLPSKYSFLKKLFVHFEDRKKRRILQKEIKALSLIIPILSPKPKPSKNDKPKTKKKNSKKCKSAF